MQVPLLHRESIQKEQKILELSKDLEATRRAKVYPFVQGNVLKLVIMKTNYCYYYHCLDMYSIKKKVGRH